MTGPEDALYAEFAEFGKAPASPKRLGLLDLLAQGPAASTTSRPPPTSSSAAVQRTSKPCAKRDWPARAATAKDLLLAREVSGRSAHPACRGSWPAAQRRTNLLWKRSARVSSTV